MQPSLTEVIRWARQAGEILRAGFGNHHQIEFKGTANLVTEMDRKSEEFLISTIRQRFPTHTIIAEESGLSRGSDESCWFIDPLDGTTNYAHNLPIFSVSIAYKSQGEIRLGVVYDPSRDECFYAERGNGAWLNDTRLHISPCTELEKALLVTGFPYEILKQPNNNIENFRRFSLRAQAVRRLGSAALDLCYVAAARFDGYWELALKPWDVAAGAFLTQEAGGLVTDMDGGNGWLTPPNSLIGANPSLHAQILAVLQEK